MKLPWQIESLFERHPTLAGFSVRAPSDVPDSFARTGEDDELFIGDVGILSELDAKGRAEIVAHITEALADVVCDEPDGLESLKGRTFVRFLH